MNAAAPASSVPGHPSRKLLVGLIGDGIQLSLTPAMQEEEAARQGLRMHYQLIDLALMGAAGKGGAGHGGAEHLPLLIDAARKMGYAGLNITHPCKQAVIPLLDDLSDDARAIGAVNTVVFRSGHATGHNTDWSGFAFGFMKSLADAPLERVVLQGAGGAGAAVAHAILTLGARALHVVDTDAVRAQALAGSLSARFPKARLTAGVEVNSALREAQGLIHATPTGMAGHPGLPVDPRALAHQPWVAEIVYFPLDTELLRTARAIGCRVCDGGGMAVGQAVGAFELFTGLKPDAARMQAHFLRLLDNRGAAGSD
jgi:shikimate dehydrogenase